MQTEPLLHWSEVVAQFVDFVSYFLAIGAVGFRYAALRDRLTRADPASPGDQAVYANAAQRAALIGLLGAAIQSVVFMLSLPVAAARAHSTVAHLLAADVQTITRSILLVSAVTGFALATGRRWIGWPFAAVGMVCEAFVPLLALQWSRLVNPLHRLAGGLWIGSLFVLVIAGLASIMRDEKTRERRGAIAAAMVNGFSPVAFTCGGVLVASGLLTAWTHLNPLSSLWTTPYGYTLLIKLCIVAVVFGLGAWNWRRQRPRLGSEEGAIAIRHSSVLELTVATIVLIVTSILVSLPSPRPPKAPKAPSAPAASVSAASSL